MDSLDHQFAEHENKRQLLTLLKEQKRRRGMEDLHFLCKNILHYTDLTESDKFHGEYCRHLEDEKKKFKLTLTPRGTLKSSIGTIGGSIRDIIRNPNVRILIGSEKFTISTKFLAEIKGHFEENQEFRELYGNLVGKKTWTGSEIIVANRTHWKKEPTISCAGIDVTKVGMHYDVIRVDDPHSEKNTGSQDQIDKVIRWYKLLLSLLDPGGRLYITGTVWHYSDLYSYIINKEKERAEKGRKIRFSIFRKDSFDGTVEDLMDDKIPKKKLLWPQRLSADFLREQYLEQGPYIFSCQYRLNPVDDENAVFKRSWFRTYDPEVDLPEKLSIYSTADPMRDEDGGDYLSITTVGIDKDYKGYILDVRRLKADEHDTVEELYDVYKKFKPIKMGMEAVAWQKSFYKYVTMLSIIKNKRLPMVALKTDTTKTKKMRVKSMVPYFRAGLFLIPAPNGIDNLTGNMAVLVDELTRYPKIRNDDCADALSYINQISHRPNVVSILTRLPAGSFMAIRAKAIKGNKPVLGSNNVRKSAHA